MHHIIKIDVRVFCIQNHEHISFISSPRTVPVLKQTIVDILRHFTVVFYFGKRIYVYESPNNTHSKLYQKPLFISRLFSNLKYREGGDTMRAKLSLGYCINNLSVYNV